MEWKKVKRDFKVNEKSINEESNTEMHVSSTNELTDDEINFELEDKKELINRLMKREIDDEDYSVTHVV